MAEPEETVPNESDLELLRRYEPVLSYTDGERFFPVAVEDYVRCCGLWRGEEQLVPAGELTTEVLVATAALATLGWVERSPTRTRSPNAEASSESEFLIDEAVDICCASCSLCAVSRSLRRANWASARSLASLTMSTPLPPPSAVTMDPIELMAGRTAPRARG